MAGEPDGAPLKSWASNCGSSRGAALLRNSLSGSWQTHRAARLAPLEAALMKILSSFGLRLLLPSARARHDHRIDMALTVLPSAIFAAARQISMRPLVQEPMRRDRAYVGDPGSPFRPM